jgi:DNA polymerase-3 subunit alpha
LRRVKDQGLNKKGLESLIECGALDSLGERGQMLAQSNSCLSITAKQSKSSRTTLSLATWAPASATDLSAPACARNMRKDRLAWEKELLGLYVSGHPLDRFKEKLAKSPTTTHATQTAARGITAVAAGMIEDVRMILTKNGDQMAFVKIVDFGGTIEAAYSP